MIIKQKIVCFLSFVLILFSGTGWAQNYNNNAVPKLSENDLKKLVAPIALYPDPLLSEILPASTYPLEIVQAARIIHSKKDFSKIDSQNWDSSVKAVAHYPTVLKMMNDKLEWTGQLGQAVLNQQQDVLQAVQGLRQQAQSTGNLKSTAQQNVIQTGETIEIVPSDPQVIYVPTYNSELVYTASALDVAVPLISFGVGFGLGSWLDTCFYWPHYSIIYGGPFYWGWYPWGRPYWGWNNWGWNNWGGNRWGWNYWGGNHGSWNQQGWNHQGWNQQGWNQQGWNQQNWNHQGWNSGGGVWKQSPVGTQNNNFPRGTFDGNNHQQPNTHNIMPLNPIKPVNWTHDDRHGNPFNGRVSSSSGTFPQWNPPFNSGTWQKTSQPSFGGESGNFNNRGFRQPSPLQNSGGVKPAFHPQVSEQWGPPTHMNHPFTFEKSSRGGYSPMGTPHGYGHPGGSGSFGHSHGSGGGWGHGGFHGGSYR
jgi:hypothetical protein